jgi:WD40 repeat protein
MHDGYLIVWDWKTTTQVGCNKVTSKVYSVSFAEDGNYFVTCGLRHVKYWYVDSIGKKTDKVSKFQ